MQRLSQLIQINILDQQLEIANNINNIHFHWHLQSSHFHLLPFIIVIYVSASNQAYIGRW